jgi:uncharacterized protein (DUF362 family)
MKKILKLIGSLLLIVILLFIGYLIFTKSSTPPKITNSSQSIIYRALNGTPSENITKVIELMGGIEKIIGGNDVVVIKPNVQWWNHGATNLSALKTLVDLIMNRPSGFYGEVVIAENCHRGREPWTVDESGWIKIYERNSDIEGINNFYELTNHLKKTYGERYSTIHWIDVAYGEKRVFSPADGMGYVYCDGTGGVPMISMDNGETGDDFREVIMTYPIFKTDRGTIIDLKNGIWKDGAYTEQPLRFINFATINHHGHYVGATGAVKNYFGVVDISGGGWGKLADKYNNFHSFAYNEWDFGPVPGIMGAEVAMFMNTIRKADLNIIAAEWVGLASRTEPPVAHTKTVMVSTDPVALDYHATKYLLHPNSNIPIHNPDNKQSPLRHYLVKCDENGGGVFDETQVEVKSYDLKTNSFQTDDNLVVSGETTWGSHFKTLYKYLKFRIDF